jgi:hypothetical protein
MVVSHDDLTFHDDDDEEEEEEDEERKKERKAETIMQAETNDFTVSLYQLLNFEQSSL